MDATNPTDAKTALERKGLAATAKRELVVRLLSAAGRPVTPQELLAELGARMNRVTLYRILDLLVEHGVAARHNAGERAFRYCLHAGGTGLAGAEGHEEHAHFTCARCGVTSCLDSRGLAEGLRRLFAALPMRVDSAELHLGGVCQGCLGV